MGSFSCGSTVMVGREESNERPSEGVTESKNKENKWSRENECTEGLVKALCVCVCACVCACACVCVHVCVCV